MQKYTERLIKKNVCQTKIDFMAINKSFKESILWDKPKDKIISTVMKKNFQRIKINKKSNNY